MMGIYSRCAIQVNSVKKIYKEIGVWIVEFGKLITSSCINIMKM
jgi:hypothetical protein